MILYLLFFFFGICVGLVIANHLLGKQVGALADIIKHMISKP